MKLYNEAVKNDFMEQHSHMNHDNVLNMFERITPKEYKLNKDLYDFTIAEIIEFYKGTGVASVDILYNMNNLFRRYTAWALAKQMVKDGQNHYDELNEYKMFLRLVNPIKLNSQFITRQELLNDCEAMPNPLDAFVALGLYEGIGADKNAHGDEFVGLNMDDFKDGKVFLNSGRSFEVSKELIKYAQKATDTYNIIPFISEEEWWQEDGDFTILNYNANDKNIMKCTNNQKNSEVNGRLKTRTIMARLKTAFGKDVYAPKALIRAGLVEYIKQIAKGNTDYVEVITNNYDQISYRYGSIPNITKFVSKYQKYLEKTCE